MVSRVHDKNGAIAPSMTSAALTQNRTHFAPMVRLDDFSMNQLDKFVKLGRGEPGIRYMEICATLSDSANIMRIVREILKNNCAGELPPPLMENLSQLLHDLGQASRAL